jgi:hypothetical protein
MTINIGKLGATVNREIRREWYPNYLFKGEVARFVGSGIPSGHIKR